MTINQKVFLIVVLGIAARLLMLLFVDPLARIGAGDDGYYIALADSIRAGRYWVNGVPDLQRPPGYPAFLALFPPVTIALAAQCLLSIMVAVAAARVTRSTLAGAMIAVCPFLIVLDLDFLSETLFICLLVASFLALFQEGMGRAIVGGTLLGGAILTRETLLLMPLALIAIGFLLGRRRDMAIAAAFAYLVVTPWAVRNANLPNGSFTLAQGHPGHVLWVGTWERNGDWMRDGVLVAKNYPEYAFRSPQERQRLEAALPSWDDRPFMRAAKERIASNPFEVAVTWVKRYPQMWFGTRTEMATLRLTTGSLPWTLFKAAMFALNALVLALGLWGAWLARRTRYALFIVPIVYHAAIYIPFHNVEDRYTLPAIPFLLILAAYGITRSTRAKWPSFGTAFD